MKAARILIGGLLAASGIVAAAPAPAATSAPLLAGSIPAHGAVLDRPPRALELRFAPPARLIEVILAGSDGDLPMMVNAARNKLRYTLPIPRLPVGLYTVDWRATAGGREHRGTFRFIVR